MSFGLIVEDILSAINLIKFVHTDAAALASIPGIFRTTVVAHLVALPSRLNSSVHAPDFASFTPVKLSQSNISTFRRSGDTTRLRA